MLRILFVALMTIFALLAIILLVPHIGLKLANLTVWSLDHAGWPGGKEYQQEFRLEFWLNTWSIISGIFMSIGSIFTISVLYQKVFKILPNKG